MGAHSTRTTPEIDEYLAAIIREGYAKNESEAIKLILLERMLRDKGGRPSPFKYRVGPTPRNTKGKKREGKEIGKAEIFEASAPQPEKERTEESEEIRKESTKLRSSSETDSAPLRDAAAYRGSLARTAAAGISPTSEYFGSSEKPIYPGTMEDYEKDPQKNMFNPPEA